MVAEPPRPTSTVRAPCSIALAISSPVPRVVAASGSLPSAPPARASPLARAISITAVRRSIRHPASTGLPSGPVTTVVRLPPPNTSSSPSPPSDIGTSSQSRLSSQHAAPIAAVASTAVRVPRNLSTAASTRIASRYPATDGCSQWTVRSIDIHPSVAAAAGFLTCDGKVSPWPSPCESRPPCVRCPAGRRRSTSLPARSATSSPSWTSGIRDSPSGSSTTERLRRFVNVFVDDDDVRYLQGLDTKVPDGQTVSIIPAVAGG